MAERERAPPAVDAAAANQPGVADDEAIARAAFRYGIRYVLRLMRMGVDQVGDPTTLYILYGLWNANSAFTDGEPGGPTPYDALDSNMPEEARRPVSILALANSLGLPYETTRRQVARLAALGACKRVRGGYIVAAEPFDQPVDRERFMTNVANLRRLVRSLKRAGANLD